MTDVFSPDCGEQMHWHWASVKVRHSSAGTAGVLHQFTFVRTKYIVFLKNLSVKDDFIHFCLFKKNIYVSQVSDKSFQENASKSGPVGDSLKLSALKTNVSNQGILTLLTLRL